MPYILPAAKHPALRLPGTTSLARSSLPWLAAIVKFATNTHNPNKELSIAVALQQAQSQNHIEKINKNIKALQKQNAWDWANLEAEDKKLSAEVCEFINHIREHNENKGIAEEVMLNEKYLYIKVEQHDKTDPQTFFLSNQVGCCLGVGSAQFGAMIERRMDDAFLFHTATNVDSDEVVALIWLYLAETTDGGIALVANFFEVRHSLGMSETIRKGLVHALLDFTKEYMEDNPNLTGLYMNELAYGHNMGDLDMYPVKPYRVKDKLGGCYSGEYYLTSLNSNRFHEYDSATMQVYKMPNIISLAELIRPKIPLDLEAYTHDEIDEFVLLSLEM